MKYLKTEKTQKFEWRATREIAELEALGTPEALARAVHLRWLEGSIYRMGGFGRWIAKQDLEPKK